MIPAALCGQLEQGLADFLRVSFWSSTPGMETVIERLISTPGAVLKGPYVSLSLPFREGSAEEPFPELPLGFPAHLHQELAFARLGSGKDATPRSTIIATGTGSGKTEAFLWPILDHCRRHIGEPGIKAILIYPMNALATDQALRVAQAIHGNDALRGAVRAGLFIGESLGPKRQTHKSMGPRNVITDRERMRQDPPDILLTNYKMLDYLLVRPSDQDLWQHNRALDGSVLRYLVVDELHSFDGAQGTDLACLLRRLKARLGIEPGNLCCVGTSATLGGPEAAGGLQAYAEEVFGEPFEGDAVITESRQSAEELFAGRLIDFAGAPLDAPDELDGSRYAGPDDYIVAQQALWFDEPLPHEPLSPEWRVALGEQLLRHGMLRNLVSLLETPPVSLPDLVAGLGRTSRRLSGDPEHARLAVVSFLSLVSEARAWLPERPEARARREAQGRPPPTRPFLDVRLQLWQRELRRMVADIAPEPTLRFSDDLTDEQRGEHLPLVHCRDCGAMGWGAIVTRDRPDVYRSSLDRFYRAFFSDDPRVRFLWPSEADRGAWEKVERFPLDRSALTRVRDADPDPDDVVQVVVSDNLRTVGGRQQLHRDCPFCEARGSLALLGFRAATLTSIYIDQLFASRFNDDKKLLTFSDSVQDAAHRAGFFGARTWRFNLRVALQHVVEDNDDISLAELPAAFVKRWRAGDDVGFVAAFLAPNMEWLHDYEDLVRSGELPPRSSLPGDVERRIGFEIFTEYGHQARIGRALARTGCSTVYVDEERLDAATDAILEPLRNEVGGLRDLDRATLRRLLLGMLHHLRERGGIQNPELPSRYVQTLGKEIYGFTKIPHLPNFGPTSRLPALVTNAPRTRRFDQLVHGGAGGGRTWYERWVQRCVESVCALSGEPRDVWQVVLPRLVSTGLLTETETPHGRAWGVQPSALRVTAKTTRIRCRICRHWMDLAQTEEPAWVDMPCLTARCSGRYEPDVGPPVDYFGRLYRIGQLERVFSQEHTGLLSREERETIEHQFKAEPGERKPWFPNLLSCTPTLEMGIDIGTLSTAILCSVPPSPASYLQRIGRAGRRDGSSMLVTLAQAKPHDLYFYAEPEEMIRGDVQPPGVFLNASAVLERQLAAFCLDCWNAEGGATTREIGQKLQDVFASLDDPEATRFPHDWLEFVRTREKQLLTTFVGLFADRLTEGSRRHLQHFLMGDRKDEGSLGWKVLDALRGERKQWESLRSQAQKVRRTIAELRKTVARDKDHAERLEELQREKESLDKLVKGIESTQTLQFLTDQGLLPNYAFPESPIRLRSVIWKRKKQRRDGDTSGYDTRTYDYARPAMAALSELAPENRFFAGGRRVTIDQVDVATASLEGWRFCDQCSHCTPVDHEDNARDCPSCGSPAWGEDSQRRQLLRLRQVFANTSDQKSRIQDEEEERQPRHYNRNMLLTFRSEDRDGAWQLDVPSVPFAFEYLRRASFREFNFGELTDQGTPFSIAGRSEVRQGFVICQHCGKVQPERRRRAGDDGAAKPHHALWCSARKKDSSAQSFQTAVYLYREFASEALRLLLPLSEVSTERQLHSFVAAFQLGLRERYGGRVDHLHTLVYSEPEDDTHLRRQYLVLYDTVPGGTGYLKDFTREPEEGNPHPIFDVLERAFHRIRTCACVAEPERDGCYRCLFAYRNSREMAETSAREALGLLGRILEHRNNLVEVGSLSDVSVSGMMDSILEARFIEAFRRMGQSGRNIQVEKRMVRNKPGFRITVDGRVWNVEQQLDLGPDQGFPIGVSIDFVFHPGDDATTQWPVAVFLDGFQSHRPRIGKDMLQRMALLSSGSYDVWAFTWWDVDQVFHTDVEPAPFLLHWDRTELARWLGTLGLGAWNDALDAPLFQLFVDELGSGAEDRLPWEPVATAAIIAQMSRPDEIDAEAWGAEVRHRLPPAAAPWFDEVEGDWLRVRRPPSGPDTIGIWAAAPPDAVSDPGRIGDYRVLVWLDDSGGETHAPELRQTWRGYLHAFHFLRALPHVWFVTSADPQLDSEGLLRLRSGPAEAVDAAWSTLDVSPAFEPIVQSLAQTGLALPEVGLDLPDAKGYSCGIEGELVWEPERVAVVEARSVTRAKPVAEGWRVFEREELLDGVEPLVEAIRVAKGGQ